MILFVVGLGLVTQLRIQSAENVYSGSRREDLIQILDGLGAESRRLESEIAELEQTRADLQSGADRQSVARTETERRLAALAILAGTAPASGPGIRLTITDPAAKVTGEVILDAVEELRDAGAEVIEFNDTSRVVASTWFGNSDTALIVDGRTVARPIIVEAIGDPHSLEEAAHSGVAWSARSPAPGSAAGSRSSKSRACGSTPCTARRRISTLGQHRLRPPPVDRPVSSVKRISSRSDLEIRSRKCPNSPKI